MAYVVTAKVTAKEGQEEKVAEVISKLAPPTRQEPGVIFYQPHRHPENPSVFYFYEQYVDADAFQAHSNSQHFQRHWVGEAIPLLESREREFYETMDV